MFGQTVKNNHSVGDAFHLASVPESRVAVICVDIKNRSKNIGFFDVGMKTVFVDSFGFWG